MASSKLEYLLSDAETEDEDGDLPVVLPKPLPKLLPGGRTKLPPLSKPPLPELLRGRRPVLPELPRRLPVL